MGRMETRSMKIGDVKIGDKLPARYWNATETREANKLPCPCEVLDIAAGRSQSGTVFKVRTKNGHERWLDAAWFGCEL